MKPNYFDDGKPDADDWRLRLAIQLAYVPPGCLLNGMLVWHLTKLGQDPCAGCNLPRETCGGRRHT